jgi:hypothetical protein
MQNRARQRHLVSVWNPSYSATAVEEHLGVLLSCIDAYRRGECDVHEVYVWWGKARSPNRQQPLTHLAEIRALDAECDSTQSGDCEMHLYLTDYRSMYVAHVGEITLDDVREEDEEAHVPTYYGERAVDCWFRIFDIRRFVTDDTLAVVEELQKLRNTRYHDRPVSIYGGMVELPLIVTRPDCARFFEPLERKRLTDGRFWAEFDAERVGLGVIEHELRENMFGDRLWRSFDITARQFIATAEKIFRDHRADAAFDFTPVVVELSKAIEVQCNALLRLALVDVPREARHANLDGETVDVGTHGALSLSELAHVIAEEPQLNRALKGRLENGKWFAVSLPAILRDLATHRNPAAHSDRVGREKAIELRDQIVGVGCIGTLVELARVRVLPISRRTPSSPVEAVKPS